MKIDAESKTYYNCHAAKPHPVDFVWLEKNPGQLFNTDINVFERQQMLVNERNSSCEQNCWPLEDHGGISPRIEQGGTKKTHTQVITTPEIIDFTVNSDCNLSCSYCCKEYSSSWRHDIVNNGNYFFTDYPNSRYNLDSRDKILMQISQNEIKNTKHYQILLDELYAIAPGLKQLVITGGEPFLDNKLIDTLKGLPLNNDAVIQVYTGLGVEYKRFERILQNLQKLNLKNLSIVVSGENTGKFLEFNRYGNKYDDFIKKVNLLKSSKINLMFQSTITNLTIHDFHNFYEKFKDYKFLVSFSYEPFIMAPYVLDPDSKLQIKHNSKDLPEYYQKMILDSIVAEPTNQQRINAADFLKEFVRRRPDLSLSIYPESFLSWLGLNNVV